VYDVALFLDAILAATLTKGAEINVEGFEGGEVSFKSSHRLARNYNKYLCIDPCKSSQDILVTVQSGKRAKSGRITLVDSGDGSFTVTFSQLQLSDSKEYLCAVDRPGLDTYTSVHLTVKKGMCNNLAPLNAVQFISKICFFLSLYS
uniref:Immunoglobulin V-set domain-containing protein n=1 Tax=Amphiprion ocellaris TaxID=80972 RepID=A0AAQ5YPY4_AMPOC